MIVVDLVCKQQHRFEGWFASSDALEQQRAGGLLSCPVCGSHEVERMPSAPHVARSESHAHPAPVTTTNQELGDPASVAAKLMRLLQEQAAQSEDVGERFPEEARRIHAGDAESRAIRGQASVSELFELLEEGVSVLPIPPTKDELH